MREGETHHYNHDSFNTPPDSSRVVVVRKPVKPSSDRGIFFRLILSFTTISSVSLLFLLLRQEEVGNHRKGRMEEGETGGRYRNEEESVHHGIVGQWMTAY